VQFKNPYYVAATDKSVTGNSGSSVAASPTSAPGGQTSQTGTTAPSQKPFTPAGSGSVMDNVTNSDGKEFYTVKSADGNVFYLIVDKQRATDNVYLLNPVDENDLMSLAKPSTSTTASAAPTIKPITATPTPTTVPATPVNPPAKSGGSNTGMYIFVAIAVLAIGGAGYYFKIVRPKQQGAGSDSSDDDDFDNEDSDDGKTDDDTELDIDDEDGDRK